MIVATAVLAVTNQPPAPAQFPAVQFADHAMAPGQYAREPQALAPQAIAMMTPADAARAVAALGTHGGTELAGSLLAGVLLLHHTRRGRLLPIRERRSMPDRFRRGAADSSRFDA
ncbi:MAG: hypothetical protein ACTHLZ_03925 [Tepidisphaeraceae bacterium]